jgi:SAM-dependent methyltransferase
MDWPNQNDLKRRFDVLTDIIIPNGKNDSQIEILDLGCGVGLLIDYLNEIDKLNNIDYFGIDISEEMVDFANKKYAKYNFEARDILQNKLKKESYDYVIMNGLFTEKREMSQKDMFDFFQSIVKETYAASRRGISFNLMSTHVDWKRDDLFHLGLDVLTNFLVKNCSRNIIIRMDYQLYEYTVYVKK